MKFRVSSQFGALEEIRNGRIHNGIDLAMPKGTELHSIASGTVERVVNNIGGLGKGVYIKDGNGDVQIYGHLDQVSVKEGAHIDVGDLIGFSGNTGHSTGPHLHFGLMHDSQYADPTPLLNTVQHYSGEIAGPSILGVKGPAMWIIEKATGHTQGEIISSAKTHIIDWLHAAASVAFDLSFGIGLIGCAALIILGVAGLKDGFRWSGLLFVASSVIRMLLGGAAQ